MAGIGGGTVLLVGLGAAALATKPEEADFEAYLHDEIASHLRTEMAADNSQDLVTNLTKLGCSISMDDCVDLVRAGLEIEQADLFVARVMTMPISSKESVFYVGAFNNWWALDPRELRSGN